MLVTEPQRTDVAHAWRTTSGFDDVTAGQLYSAHASSPRCATDRISSRLALSRGPHRPRPLGPAVARRRPLPAALSACDHQRRRNADSEQSTRHEIKREKRTARWTIATNRKPIRTGTPLHPPPPHTQSHVGNDQNAEATTAVL